MVINKKEIKVENVLNVERYTKIHVLWCTPVYTLKTTGLEWI